LIWDNVITENRAAHFKEELARGGALYRQDQNDARTAQPVHGSEADIEERRQP
jgi:hypothetical protein